MTAQDRYRAMLRDEIAPALRERGFKGSGTAFVLPDDTHWLQVGFQSSKWNSSEQAAFTVHLSVVEKAAWSHLAAEWGLKGKPNPNAGYPQGAVWRLPPLIFGYDRWWQVIDVPDQSTGVVAEVLDAIDRIGLPCLRSKGASIGS